MRVSQKYPAVDAVQWHADGDHIRVGLYRHPYIAGHTVCVEDACEVTMHQHGWIDLGSRGIIVCPGDWVLTNPAGFVSVLQPRELEAFWVPSDPPTQFRRVSLRWEAASAVDVQVIPDLADKPAGMTADELRDADKGSLFHDLDSAAEFRKLGDGSFAGGGETWSEKGDAEHFAGRLTFYADPPPKVAAGGLITSGPGPVTTINAPASAVPIVLRAEDLDLTFTSLADLLRPASDRTVVVGPETEGKVPRAEFQGGTVRITDEQLAHYQQLADERDKAAGSALSARTEAARRRIENRDLRTQVRHLTDLLEHAEGEGAQVAEERSEALRTLAAVKAEAEKALQQDIERADALLQGPDRVRGMQRKIAAQRAAIVLAEQYITTWREHSAALRVALNQEKRAAAEADQTHRSYLALRVGELEGRITQLQSALDQSIPQVRGASASYGVRPAHLDPAGAEDRIEAARERRAADAGNDLPAGPTLGVEQLEGLAVGSEVVTGDDLIWTKAGKRYWIAAAGLRLEIESQSDHELASLNPRLRKLVAQDRAGDPVLPSPAAEAMTADLVQVVNVATALPVRWVPADPTDVTVEEMDAAPVGTVLRDVDDDRCWKSPSGWRAGPAWDLDDAVPYDSEEQQRVLGPLSFHKSDQV